MEKLLDYFTPEHYDIALDINKHNGKAKGCVKITGTPHASEIKLHAVNLNITSANYPFEVENGLIILNLNVISSGPDGARQRESERGSPVATGRADACRGNNIQIELRYTFDLNTNMEGAYLSSYDHNGEEELLVSTQFESHYARECFPCIDEPAAKATFDLSITIPDEDDIVLSNTPGQKISEAGVALRSEPARPTGRARATAPWDAEGRRPTEPRDGGREESVSRGETTPASQASYTWTFEPTPKMSTYLLAFCIGKFKKKSKTSLHGVKVTTYCTLNHKESSLNFANEIATKSLDYYDRHFGIKYPLEKLDQIAIPDFEAGAMENWGLVTYRESCLLADKTTSKSQKEYIATVIAHELSHQWFGNLVTMKWWDNLWLNESFATLMEYICVDAIHPEFRIFEDFFTGECRAALGRDAYPGVQAVQQDVTDPAEIATLFDGAIVYAKGARLMFMLYRLMGERSFFAGLKDYFKKHQYQNTTGDDLWSALQKHAKFDVKEFMDAWVLQPGFPVITDGNQQRFLLTGATDDTKWPLPKITDDMSGHYLINLASNEFSDALKNFDKLSLEQKIRLLFDRELLAKTSLVSSATLLDLLPKFIYEENYSVWGPIVNIITDLRLFFCPTDKDFKVFQKYLRGLITPQLERLGVGPLKGEDDSDTKLRSTLLGLAIFADDLLTITDLVNLYNNNYDELNPELRFHILAAKMKMDEDEVFDEMLEKYQHESNPEIKSDLLFTLASAKKHTASLIKLLKQPKIVRPQDHLYLYIRLARNYETRKKTLDWLYENWGYLEKLTGDKSIEDYPRLVASTIRTVEEAKRFEDFFAEKADSPVLRRTLKIANAEINARLRLISMDSDDVHRHLSELE